MIGLLLCVCGCVGGVAIGLIVGYRYGYKTGDAAGYARGMHGSLTIDTLQDVLHRSEGELKRYQCSSRFMVYHNWNQDMFTLAATFAVHSLCESLTRSLLANKILRPVVLSKENQGSRTEWYIGISLMAAPDPDDIQYEALDILTPAPSC